MKLTFAYDHADIQEFISLRTFQIFIQSLPLTTIHLSWFLIFKTPAATTTEITTFEASINMLSSFILSIILQFTIGKCQNGFIFFHVFLQLRI